MVTWVLYLCIGLVIGGMAGFYFAKMDDFSRKQKKSLEEKLQRSEQELIAYKDQVTDHFKETATLINDMTESYQKVHEHLAQGVVQLCSNPIEVDKLQVSPNQLLANSAEAAITEKAESEAPKEDVPTEENNKNKENVDVTVSAASAAVDEVMEDDLETGTDTVTVPETEPHRDTTQTVAASPDSTSTGSTKKTPKAESATLSQELPPPVTETMAVAEELDEASADSENVSIPGSRMVH